MTFEDEWAECKHSAAQQESTRMVLNSAPPVGPPPGGPDLKVPPEILTAAGKALETADKLQKTNASVMRETSQVATALQGFSCVPALNAFVERWQSQVNYLDTLLRDVLASGLVDAADAFLSGDARTAETFDIPWPK